MAYEMRELSGSLFFNDRKTKPSHPDYQGKVMVDGKVLRIAGWVKATQAGNRFLSLKLTLEEPKEAAAARQDDFLKTVEDAAPKYPKPAPSGQQPPPDDTTHPPDPEFDDRVPF